MITYTLFDYSISNVVSRMAKYLEIDPDLWSILN